MRIDFNIEEPGPRPKRPTKPRKPQEMFKRTEEIWCNCDGCITLADLLHMIPDGVTADNIHVNVDENADSYITYDYDIPNTKYTEQLKGYEKRLAQFEIDYPAWNIADIEWRKQRAEHDLSVIRLREEIKDAFESRRSTVEDEKDAV